MIITVANVKGGAGKTTAVMLLAMAAAARPDSNVVVIDADRQASALRWHDQARQAGEELPFQIEFLATPELQLRIDGITNGRTVSILDTGPGDADIMSRAIEVADVVLIPACPRQDDRDQAEKVARVCQSMEIPHGIVFSRVRPAEAAPAVWREDLTGEGFRVLRTEIKELSEIGNSWGGRPEMSQPVYSIAAGLLRELRELTT